MNNAENSSPRGENERQPSLVAGQSMVVNQQSKQYAEEINNRKCVVAGQDAATTLPPTMPNNKKWFTKRNKTTDGINTFSTFVQNKNIVYEEVDNKETPTNSSQVSTTVSMLKTHLQLGSLIHQIVTIICLDILTIERLVSTSYSPEHPSYVTFSLGALCLLNLLFIVHTCSVISKYSRILMPAPATPDHVANYVNQGIYVIMLVLMVFQVIFQQNMYMQQKNSCNVVQCTYHFMYSLILFNFQPNVDEWLLQLFQFVSVLLYFNLFLSQQTVLTQVVLNISLLSCFFKSFNRIKIMLSYFESIFTFNEQRHYQKTEQDYQQMKSCRKNQNLLLNLIQQKVMRNMTIFRYQRNPDSVNKVEPHGSKDRDRNRGEPEDQENYILALKSVVLQSFQKNDLFSRLFLRRLLAEQSPPVKQKRKIFQQDYIFRFFSKDSNNTNILMHSLLSEVKQPESQDLFILKPDLVDGPFTENEVYQFQVDERYLEDIAQQTFSHMVMDLFQYVLNELFIMKEKDQLASKRILILQLTFCSRQLLALPENHTDLNQSLLQHLLSKHHSTYNLKFPNSENSSSAQSMSLRMQANFQPYEKGSIMFVFENFSNDVYEIFTNNYVFIDWQQSELEKMTQKMTRAIKTKNQMMGCVAHDLRSPKNATIFCLEEIQGYIQELKLRYLETNEVEAKVITKNFQEIDQFLDFSLKNQQFLGNLVDDILDYVQISENKDMQFKLYIAPFDLIQLLEDIFYLMNIKLSGKNLKLVYEVDKSMIENEKMVVVNCPKRIKQVLVNLISNAIKFTVQGSIKVLISPVRKRKGQIQLEIKDTGCGIPPEVIQKLGMPFSTFDGEEKVNPDGIGLGLFICKKIISQIGPSKTLQIRSTVHQGSSFSFLIYSAMALPEVGPPNRGRQDSSQMVANQAIESRAPITHMLSVVDSKESGYKSSAYPEHTTNKHHASIPEKLIKKREEQSESESSITENHYSVINNSKSSEFFKIKRIHSKQSLSSMCIKIKQLSEQCSLEQMSEQHTIKRKEAQRIHIVQIKTLKNKHGQEQKMIQYPLQKHMVDSQLSLELGSNNKQALASDMSLAVNSDLELEIRHKQLSQVSLEKKLSFKKLGKGPEQKDQQEYQEEEKQEYQEGDQQEYQEEEKQEYQEGDQQEYQEEEPRHQSKGNYVKSIKYKEGKVGSDQSLGSKGTPINHINLMFADDDIFARMVMNKNLKKIQESHKEKGLLPINVVQEGIDGQQVLDYFRIHNNLDCTQFSHKTALHVIVLDFVMGVLDGVKTAMLIKNMIKKNNYHKAVLIGCTGIHVELDSPDGVHFEYIIEKPCQLQDLERILADIQRRMAQDNNHSLVCIT